MSKLKRRRKKTSSTHEFESRRVRVREPKLHRRNARCTHQCKRWSDTRSILLCICSCSTATSPIATGLFEGFFCWVEGRCCLVPADQLSNGSTTKKTSDKNMFGGGRRRSLHACVRQGRCQKTPTLTLLAEVLRASQAWGFFSLERMFFELPFEVLALTVRSTCKTGGRC